MNTALSPVVFKLKGNSYMLEYDYSVILLGIAKQARHPRGEACERAEDGAYKVSGDLPV